MRLIPGVRDALTIVNSEKLETLAETRSAHEVATLGDSEEPVKSREPEKSE